MPRGMGAIVRILARHTPHGRGRASDTKADGQTFWQTIYEGAPLRGLRNAQLQQYWTWSPTICRPHAKMNEFRLELDTSEQTGIADWNYIDWVKVTGSQRSQPGLLPR